MLSNTLPLSRSTRITPLYNKSSWQAFVKRTAYLPTFFPSGNTDPVSVPPDVKLEGVSIEALADRLEHLVDEAISQEDARRVFMQKQTFNM
jgi:hypothetical protein